MASWKRLGAGLAGTLTDAAVTVAACGGVGALIDFWIGAAGQKRLKARLEEWWIKVSYMKWRDFGREEALLAVRTMDKLFGTPLSRKRLIFLIRAWCLELLVLDIAGVRNIINNSSRLSGPLPLRSLLFVIDIIVTTLSTMIILHTSLVLTRVIATNTANWFSTTRWHNVLQLLMMLWLQYVLLGLSNEVIYTLTLVYREVVFSPFRLDGPTDYLFWSDRLKDILSFTNLSATHIFASILRDLRAVITANNPLTVVLAYGGLLTAFVNFGRLAITALFLLSFVFRPIQKPILTVWARIIESDKPVFTVTCGGIGAIAKGIQELAKVF